MKIKRNCCVSVLRTEVFPLLSSSSRSCLIISELFSVPTLLRLKNTQLAEIPMFGVTQNTSQKLPLSASSSLEGETFLFCFLSEMTGLPQTTNFQTRRGESVCVSHLAFP